MKGGSSFARRLSAARSAALARSGSRNRQSDSDRCPSVSASARTAPGQQRTAPQDRDDHVELIAGALPMADQGFMGRPHNRAVIVSSRLEGERPSAHRQHGAPACLQQSLRAALTSQLATCRRGSLRLSARAAPAAAQAARLGRLIDHFVRPRGDRAFESPESLVARIGELVCAAVAHVLIEFIERER